MFMYILINYNFFNIIEGKFNMNKIYKIIFGLFWIDYIFFCKVIVMFKGKFLLNYQYFLLMKKEGS